MEIEERVAKLERKNRRLTLVLVLVVVAAGLAVVAGMAAPEAVPDVLRAHAFVLVSGDGKPRAGLAMDKVGPRIDVLDENGQVLRSLPCGSWAIRWRSKADQGDAF